MSLSVNAIPSNNDEGESFAIATVSVRLSNQKSEGLFQSFILQTNSTFFNFLFDNFLGFKNKLLTSIYQ